MFLDFNLDIINILILVVAVVNIVYGLVIFDGMKLNRTNFYFFLLTLAVGFWGFSMMAYRGFYDIELKVFYARMLYLAATTIPITFLYFVHVFPDRDRKFSFLYNILLPLPFLCVAFISVKSNLLISGVVINKTGEDIIVFNFFYHVFYAIYIVSYFSAGYISLFLRFLKSSGVLKVQYIYIIIGTVVSTTIGVITNLIMPLLGNFSLNWLGQIGVILMITFILYSILKHHLFNIKVIATEISTFSLWAFIFVRTLISETQSDKITNFVLLALTIFIGIFLIKGVKKETSQREKIEKLAKDLEKTNQDLEHANDRLKDLDQLKSQFMSMASHQIRSPLTAIKGYTSEILEEDFGKLPDYLIAPVKTVFKSSESLLEIVEDFLNISRIEQGRMQYDFSEVDLNEMLQEVVNENKPKIVEKGISLSFRGARNKMLVKADSGKLKQVFGNLIDNAIKYTPKGAVSVSVLPAGTEVLVKISDTGSGMSQKTIHSLFQKFTRAEEARKANIQGTGLGLYVAKELLEAHQGKIWAESEGIDRGSVFWVRLNLIKNN